MMIYVLILAVLAVSFVVCQQKGERGWMNFITVVTIILVAARIVVAISN